MMTDKDLESILEGRSAINSEKFVLEESGKQIRGGINLTLSAFRFDSNLGLAYRQDVANLLDSWIVDGNEAIRYLNSGNSDQFNRIYAGVQKSIAQCLLHVISRSVLLRMCNDTAEDMIIVVDKYILSVSCDFKQDSCSLSAVVSNLLFWLLARRKAKKLLMSGLTKEFVGLDRRVHVSMMELFFSVTNAEERVVYATGEVLQ